MRVIWQDDAIDDLDEIREFITKENPAAAARVVSRVRTGLELLQEHPLIGRRGRVQDTREFIFSDIPYIAVYRVDHERQTLEILHFIHTAQLYPRDL